MRHSPNLSALRTAAVGMVVVSHLPFLPQHSPVYHTQALGYLGVMIFFVLTSLVLLQSLHRQHQKSGFPLSTITFMVQRAFRIYPLSLAAVSVMALFACASGSPVPLGTLLANLTLTQNITGAPSLPPALWSLPFEVQMYLTLPLLYVLAHKAKTKAPLALAALIAASACLILVAAKLGLNYHLAKYLPCFLPGVLAFTLRHRTPVFSPWILILFIAATTIIYPMAVAAGLSETLLAWPFCLALGVLIPHTKPLKNISINTLTKTIETYAYGIYLIHGPALATAFVLWPHAPLKALSLGLILTAGLTYISYHLLENPLTKLGKKLTIPRATG